MNCRHCNQPLYNTFVDLGFAPPSNAYLGFKDLTKAEVYYPLKLKVCHSCWLVQTEDYATADELFSSEYAYFSSTSASWLEHAKKYSKEIIQRLSLNSQSMVLEIASNDGYLLKNFVQKDIPCLGVEPTDSTAEAAESLNIPVLRDFFGEQIGHELREQGKQADLIVGNNVYAHVPDVNDFTRGLKAALKPDGTITLEFPHLMRLIEHIQFDTVYHEHFSYFSLYTVIKIFNASGLQVYDVEELSTHGGSLRIYGCHKNGGRNISKNVRELLKAEQEAGMQNLETYQKFQEKANLVKDNLLKFLLDQKRLGKLVVAYGAAAKGNTLLNYAGVKTDLLPFVYDAARSKQGKYMPGSHIPILAPKLLNDTKPDYVLILPWNISNEIKSQLENSIKPSTKFVVSVPQITLV